MLHDMLLCHIFVLLFYQTSKIFTMKNSDLYFACFLAMALSLGKLAGLTDISPAQHHYQIEMFVDNAYHCTITGNTPESIVSQLDHCYCVENITYYIGTDRWTDPEPINYAEFLVYSFGEDEAFEVHYIDEAFPPCYSIDEVHYYLLYAINQFYAEN